MPLVLNADGRALIYDRALGRVMAVSIPTALENVANSKGQIVHGDDGPAWDGAPVESPVGKKIDIDISSTELVGDNVLPLPAGEIGINETATIADAPASPIRPVSDEHRHVPAHNEPDPLDHDGDGKKGGSRARAPRSPEEQARRDAVVAALNAKGIVFFKGAKTEDLEAKLSAA